MAVCLSATEYAISLLTAATSILFSFAMNYGMYEAIKFYKRAEEDNKPPAILIIIELLFITFSSLTMICLSVVLITSMSCTDASIITTARTLFSICYALQILSLHLLWMYRLKFVFQGTVYKVPSICFLLYVIALCLVFIISMAFLVWKPSINSHLFSNNCFIYGTIHAISAMFLSLLVYTFVFKLNNLNINATGSSGLESAIIRNLVLGLIPPVVTSVLCTVMIIPATLQSVTPILLVYSLKLMDITTNAICLLLTYKYFQKTYVVCCGIMDAKCTKIYEEYYEKSVSDEKKLELSKRDPTQHTNDKTPSPDINTMSLHLCNLESLREQQKSKSDSKAVMQKLNLANIATDPTQKKVFRAQTNRVFTSSNLPTHGKPKRMAISFDAANGDRDILHIIENKLAPSSNLVQIPTTSSLPIPTIKEENVPKIGSNNESKKEESKTKSKKSSSKRAYHIDIKSLYDDLTSSKKSTPNDLTPSLLGVFDNLTPQISETPTPSDGSARDPSIHSLTPNSVKL